MNYSEKYRRVHIDNQWSSFWVCLWLFLIWITLSHINTELCRIRMLGVKVQIAQTKEDVDAVSNIITDDPNEGNSF